MQKNVSSIIKNVLCWNLVGPKNSACFLTRLATLGQSEPLPPNVLPRPHRRLRSAYIMQAFDGEIQDMSSKLSQRPIS